MKHLLERIVLLTISQELDVLALQPTATARPAEYLRRAIERVKPRLAGMGIPHDKIAQVITEADAASAFIPSLVANPAYWRQFLHRQVRFFLVHSRPSRFHDLLEYLKGMSHVSYATCYGETDFVIRLHATDEHTEHFETMLDRLGVTSTALSVAAVPYYLGHEERRVQRSVAVDAQEVDRLLAARVDTAGDDEIRRLVDSGIALGVVVRENHLATGRLRAYVTISLRGELTGAAKTALEHKVIQYNSDAPEGHAMPLVSLYRLYGRPQYLLELICDDQAQLDAVTVSLLTLDNAIDNTETLVIARYVVASESFSTPRIDEDQRTQQLKDVVDKVLAPISDQLLGHISESQATRFINLDPHSQLRVLNLYQELTADYPCASLFSANPLEGAVIDFITGIIEQNTSRVTNAGMTVIRDHVERCHLILASHITDEIFGGDAQKWQSTLKTANANWNKWGLRPWGERIYQTWNAHPLLQHLFRVDPEVLDSLRILGDARNNLAHPRNADLTEVTRLVREVFNRSYKVLHWLEEVTERIKNPVIPFQAAAATIVAGRHGRELEVISDMKSLRVDLRRLALASAKQDEQLLLLVNELESVAQGVRAFDATLLEKFSRDVIPRLTGSERGTALAMLDALKASLGTIPAGIVSSLLAAMLAAALKLAS